MNFVKEFIKKKEIKYYFQIGNLLLGLIILGLSVNILFNFLPARRPLVRAQKEKIFEEHVMEPSIVNSKSQAFSVYAENIDKRDLFGVRSDRQDTRSVVLKKALPALHKRIKLIGILMADDSQAIVEDLKEKQVHFLSKGERVGQVMLEDVQEDRAIFMYDDKRVEMTP